MDSDNPNNVSPSKVSQFFSKTGPFIGALLLIFWGWCIFGATSEKHQGEIYRIIYLHVPAAFTTFFLSFTLFINAVLALKKPKSSMQLFGRANAELGLLFTVITLVTGSIWGKPTWGTWWTWDARLTTTFLLGLLYAGYLLLWSSMSSGPERSKACAILGILIFIDVPIIYKSVTWWRTLHQPPSILREGGSTMAPEILTLILTGSVITILAALWLTWGRYENIKLREELEHHSLAELS